MASTNIKMLNKTGNNEQSDECYTPTEAIKPLFEFLAKDITYYDCTSGISGSIVDTLNQNGFTCKASEGRDFLTDTFDNYDAIITNPPYSKKDAFIERCYASGKPFALLLPVSAIQGIKRGKMFSDYGVELLVLNKRIDFTCKGAPHFGVAWFCRFVLDKQIEFR